MAGRKQEAFIQTYWSVVAAAVAAAACGTAHLVLSANSDLR